MDEHQERPGLADLRHRHRKLRNEKLRSAEKPEKVVEQSLSLAQVITAGAGMYTALKDGVPVKCRTLLAVAPGDWVTLTAAGSVHEVQPRKTLLSRPDPGNQNRERVVAANMDCAVIVAAAADPPFRPGLIDRYLIAIERGGAEAILCINKCDLAEPADLQAVVAEFGGLARIVMCSARSGEGIAELRAALAGRLSVFVGHSGVGKSSLLNALAPDIQAATGAVSEGNRKGQHTTTGSRIYDLGGGIRVMDTPGIREFGLWRIEPGDVRNYFHDFDEAAASCRFHDCLHLHEPGCGVVRCVDAGSISRERYERYRRLCAGT